jgi:hypothetical protein
VSQPCIVMLTLTLKLLGYIATQNTSGPIVLCLSHSAGVEGHQDHFWARGAASTSFRRRRPPRPLLGRSGYVYLIQASKSYQDRFGAGRAVSNLFRCRSSAIHFYFLIIFSTDDMKVGIYKPHARDARSDRKE